MASLVGFLGDIDLAEEAAQEAFAIAAERWPRDGLPQHPVAWLVATGRNRAIDRVRMRKRRSELLAGSAPDLQPAASAGETDSAGSLWAVEKAGAVRSALAALAPDQQKAVELAFFSGLTQQEIAAQLNEPLGTIKARIRRGLHVARLMYLDAVLRAKRGESNVLAASYAKMYSPPVVLDAVVAALDILGVDALWSGRQAVVRFNPDGASTGAVLKLSREKAEYEIRVNWYTGGVAIAP